MDLLNPSGTAVLVKRVRAVESDLDDATAAAQELCKRHEAVVFTELVHRFFEGDLTNAVFNVLCDAFDEVQRVRNLDHLDAQFA